MKVSTSYFYDRSTLGITEAQGRLATVQAKLASGKQLVAPSEDPDRALAIERVNGAIASQEALRERLDTVRARIDAQETALGSASSILARIKELALRGVDDTLSPSNRDAIALEIELLREQMVTLANSRDDGGSYLFGGSAVGAPPFVDAGDAVGYQGDQTPGWLVNGSQQLLEFNRAGTAAFGRVVRTTDGVAQGVAFFDVLDQLAAAVRGSDRSGMQRGLGELDELNRASTIALVEIGASGAALDNQVSLVEESVLRLKTARSGLEDLDYAEAIAQMNKEMTSLQAAITSFGKIAQLNLFNLVDI